MNAGARSSCGAIRRRRICHPTEALEDAIEAAERLRLSIEKRAVRTQATALQVTCGIGVAEKEPGDSIDSSLRRADWRCMKPSGRDATGWSLLMATHSLASTKIGGALRELQRGLKTSPQMKND